MQLSEVSFLRRPSYTVVMLVALENDIGFGVRIVEMRFLTDLLLTACHSKTFEITLVSSPMRRPSAIH